MSPSSFRKSLELPPPGYRTPSPPRFAFEPLSPINTVADGIALRRSEINFHNGVKRPLYAQLHCAEVIQSLERDVRGTMETFASIALATRRPSPVEGELILTYPPFEPTQPEESRSTERPSKRARSEKPCSPEWARPGASTDTRPATSYEHSSDNRTFEAELLLNLSHEARFSKSWEANRQIGTNPMHGKNENSPRTSHEPTLYYSGALGGYNLNEGISISTTSGNLSNQEKTTNGNETKISSNAFIVNGRSTPTRILSQTSPCNTHARGNTSKVCVLEDQSSKIIQEKSGLLCPSSDDIIDDDQAVKYPSLPPPTELEAETVQTPDPHLIKIRKEPIQIEKIKSPLPLDTSEDETGSKVLRGITETPEGQNRSGTSNLGHDSQSLNETTPTQADVYDQSITGLMLPSPTVSATCSACHFTRNSSHFDSEINSTSWISCDGCKSWFHFACAGFKSEREVRSVDKYRCQKCKHLHGSTTYVRKSSRAHSAIDYAGLNEGVIKTSDERPEHHYIKPIKEGIITFLPENFVRMRPELVTAEFFEKGNGMKEPIVIPAYLNPQPIAPMDENFMNVHQKGLHNTLSLQDSSLAEEWLPSDTEFQSVPDQGQDALDMVMPRKLTVRMVADLYGPEEKVEVIDVKSQNGEGKKWNMRRWADYYESSSDKAVRNVISLEVSNSRLGRLIRRPQIVRDLDLQDSVWPQELVARGEYPRVQLYCLMSVADCFTDFHIDFGGSSVFYHILKGKKTFLFIPPKEKHLKKYEEWCMSPAQNWTFLADQTKECYRVDLKEGDTMLIPAGWIHAVWTPEDSLVIGGNFLTRMHYGMQIRIVQLEKATGVARKFRYPHFQKLHWYTALRYMEDDPLPESLKAIFREGGNFHREQPAHYSFDEWGENSKSGLENYHVRYYAQSELEGLPDLTRYLLRTALIDFGSITEGITAEMRNAVKRAIPRGYGEPLDIVKDFAMWCAWKRGNEPIPHWAYPHATPEGGASDSVGKLSAAALKKLEQEATLQAPRRQSARRRSQQQFLSTTTVSGFSGGLSGSRDRANQGAGASACAASSATPTVSNTPLVEKPTDATTQGLVDVLSSDTSKRPRKPSKTGMISHRKPACDSCRKRRRACKHRDQPAVLALDHRMLEPTDNAVADILNSKAESLFGAAGLSLKTVQAHDGDEARLFTGGKQEPLRNSNNESRWAQSLEAFSGSSDLDNNREENLTSLQNQGSSILTCDSISLDKLRSPVSLQHTFSPHGTMKGLLPKEFDPISGNSSHSRGRTKACNDCRKSKRRCIHDEHGNEDPAKAREAAIPRVAAALKRRKHDNEGQNVHPTKMLKSDTKSESLNITQSASTSPQSVEQPDINIQRPISVAITARQRQNSEDRLFSHLTTSTPIILQSHADDLVHVQSQASDDEEVESLKLIMTHPPVAPEIDLLNQDMEQSPKDVEDEVQLIAATPHAKMNQKELISSEVPGLEQSESFEQPAASSLVSPPASSHDDAEEPLPPPHSALTPCTSSSRHSSRHSKQVQRYTPESGPARRASSSSVGDVVTSKSTSESTNLLTAASETESHLGQRNTKTNPNFEVIADEESLKLIKELQAQEHGLRRRGRAS